MCQLGKRTLQAIALVALLSSGVSVDLGSGSTAFGAPGCSDEDGPKPKGATETPFMKGTPSLRFPKGKPGKVVVVAAGPIVPTPVPVLVPVVLRNNTCEVLTALRVRATAADASGEPVSRGEGEVDPYSAVYPSVLRPGEVGFSRVYFDPELPPDAEFTFRASGKKATPKQRVGEPLEIVQQSVGIGERLARGVALDVSVTVRNRAARAVDAEFGVAVMCFDNAGIPLDMDWSFNSDLDASLDEIVAGIPNEIAPKETLSYSTSASGHSLAPNTDCPKYLVSVGSTLS